jgi:hypothetical protein
MDRQESRPRFVFILGVSRSGTTLMKRLLNTYPSALIWGEHHTFVRQLSAAFYRVYESPYVFQDQRPWQERIRIDEREHYLQGWINPFGRANWVEHFRDLLDVVFVPPEAVGCRFIGFKDPGYAATPEDRSIEFLHLLYPTAIFVFIVRNGFNRVASAREAQLQIGGRCWLLVDGKRHCDRWVNQNRRLLMWHQSGNLNSFWIRYEDLIQGTGEVRRLLRSMHLEWGGEQSELMDCQPGWISSFQDPVHKGKYNERWKALPLLWRCYAFSHMARFSQEMGYRLPRLSILQRSIGWTLLGLGHLLEIAIVGRVRKLAKRVSRLLMSAV